MFDYWKNPPKRLFDYWKNPPKQNPDFRGGFFSRFGTENDITNSNVTYSPCWSSLTSFIDDVCRIVSGFSLGINFLNPDFWNLAPHREFQLYKTEIYDKFTSLLRMNSFVSASGTFLKFTKYQYFVWLLEESPKTVLGDSSSNQTRQVMYTYYTQLGIRKH